MYNKSICYWINVYLLLKQQITTKLQESRKSEWYLLHMYLFYREQNYDV